MKKNILVSLVFFFVTSLFAQNVKMGILNGPSCVPVSYLQENIKSKEITVDYEMFADPQTMLPKLLKNEIDVGFMPANVAAKVYNASNKKIVCLAITGNGNLSLITKNKKIKKLSELKGKTVYVAGQGATPEYVFATILKENKIDINTKDGVTLDFSIPTPQLAAQLISGKIEYALVPEPFATVAVSASKDVICAIDIQKEFQKVYGKNQTFPLTVMIANAEFASQHPQIINSLLDCYNESYKMTVKNPVKAAELCNDLNLGLNASIIEKSIPKANYTFVDAREGREQIEWLLQIFLNFSSESIGNKLPDEGFYYLK